MGFLQDVGGWIGEAGAALLLGWAASKLDTKSRIQKAVDAAKKEILDELNDAKATLEAEIQRIDGALAALKEEEQDNRVQSGIDHAGSAALGETVSELKKQSLETYAKLNQILGLLEGKGIKR